MISLQELQEIWQEDCKVDELNLGQESSRIPELHSKYLNHLTIQKKISVIKINKAILK